MNAQISALLTATVREQVGDTVFMIRRCRECATLTSPLVLTCTSCQSTTLDWVPSSGEGSIVSWRVMYRVPPGSRLKEWAPCLIAIVALDEGPWVYTTVEGEIPSSSDQPVRVAFQPKPATGGFPVFTTARPGGEGTGNQLSAHPRRPNSPNDGLSR